MIFQGYAVLPLLPISFPTVWIALNLYGAAKVKVLFQFLKEKGKVSTQQILNSYNCFVRNNRKSEVASIPHQVTVGS